MKYPIRNIIYEKVKQAGNMTDTELIRALEKEDKSISWPDFNKILLDLEIYGLIRVSWVTKDKRRIEVAEGRGFPLPYAPRTKKNATTLLKWHLSFREPASRDFRQSTSFYLDVLYKAQNYEELFCS